MGAEYEEEIYFKSKFKLKFNEWKNKKISLTFFVSLISIYIAMIITFTIVYHNYKLTHPYTSQEISALTSIVYVLPYLDTDSGISYYVEADYTTSTQEETQTETTAQIIEETAEVTTTTVTTQTTTQSSTTILSTSLDANALVYVTSSGTKFHFSTCSYLSGSKIEMTYAQVIDSGYSPCSRCFPNG